MLPPTPACLPLPDPTQLPPLLQPGGAQSQRALPVQATQTASSIPRDAHLSTRRWCVSGAKKEKRPSRCCVVCFLTHPCFRRLSLSFSVGDKFYVILEGVCEVLHTPIHNSATSPSSRKLGETGGSGVIVRDEKERRALGCRVGVLPAGECFGENSIGQERDACVISNGAEVGGAVYPALILQVDGKGEGGTQPPTLRCSSL